jgi:hypothetical protein
MVGGLGEEMKEGRVKFLGWFKGRAFGETC